MKRKTKWLTAILATVATCAVALFAGCSAIDWVEQQFCDHTFNAGTVTRASTCTKEGELTKTCTECGYEETVSIGKAAHKEETVAMVSPTCMETGKTDSVKCSVCDEVITEPAVLPALGHSIVAIEGVSPTCTTSGLTVGSHCERCDFVQLEQETISALGHNVVTVTGYAATCAETGLSDGQKCERCDTVFVEQETLSATGLHTYETVIETYPTCKDVGRQYQQCTVCGLKGEYEDISTTAHTYKTVAAQAATCTESGWKEYQECIPCGTILGYEEIPATGHTYVDYVCSVCGSSETDGLVETALVEGETAVGNWYRIYEYEEFAESVSVSYYATRLRVTAKDSNGNDVVVKVTYRGVCNSAYLGVSEEHPFTVIQGNGYIDVLIEACTFEIDNASLSEPITVTIDSTSTVDVVDSHTYLEEVFKLVEPM